MLATKRRSSKRREALSLSQTHFCSLTYLGTSWKKLVLVLLVVVVSYDVMIISLAKNRRRDIGTRLTD